MVPRELSNYSIKIDHKLFAKELESLPELVDNKVDFIKKHQQVVLKLNYKSK